MEVWEAIVTRRSVRAFQPNDIEDPILLKLVEAARWAPSGSNIQPWHFIIIKNELQIKKIKAFSPGMPGIPGALIVIATDLGLAEKKGGKLARNVLSLMDAALAAHNIALAAVDIGLGTCMVRSFNPEALQEILKLPSEIVPQLIMAIGYPAKIPPAPKRKELKEIISWEIYQKEGEPSC
jgi:nitroreductase